MSDEACVGICMIDPDSGCCIGCGRTPDEIFGVPSPAPVAPEENRSAAQTLPDNVRQHLGDGSD